MAKPRHSNKYHVLVIDPQSSSAKLTKQTLEELGHCRVLVASSGEQALSQFMRMAFDLIFIEAKLDDLPATALVKEMYHYRGDIPVIVALSGTAELSKDWEGIPIRGVLTKPFFIPNLKNLLNEILEPPTIPLPETPKPPKSIEETGPLTTAPPWLKDVNKAAQYLTTLTLESSSEAALLTRGRRLYAYAGQFPREEVEELAQIVAENWDNEGSQSAQVRFVRMSNGSDYLLYSTLTTGKIVLSLAFMAETPLRSIRQQARKLTDALLAGPETRLRAATPTETDVSPTSPPTPPSINPAPEELTQWETRLQPPSPPVDVEDPDVPVLPAEPKPHYEDTAPADWQLLPRSRKESSKPPDDAPVDEEDTAPADWQSLPEPEPSKGSTIESTVILSGSHEQRIPGMPGVYRTPHGLYKLTYTFLWVPKLPDVKLRGDIVKQLEAWVRHYALAYDWRIERFDVQPEAVQLTVACSPADSPEKVVRTLMDSTSERIMSEFPRLARRHPAGNFWAPGYYVVTPGRALKSDEIERYIDYQRSEQGLG